jgi:hypothetical protein
MLGRCPQARAASEILDELRFFETIVEVKRIRNGEHQMLETLINEEAKLFAKYLGGKQDWIPRIPNLPYERLTYC